MGSVVLEHRVIEPVIHKQEGSGFAVLGNRVDKLVAHGRRAFVPDALSYQDSGPFDPGHEDSRPAVAGLDLDPAPARVDLVDMYTGVSISLVGFPIARVDLAVTKFVLGVAEVGPVKV